MNNEWSEKNKENTPVFFLNFMKKINETWISIIYVLYL